MPRSRSAHVRAVAWLGPSKGQASPDDPEAGTTLIELLVALALLALIALFIGEGIAAIRAMAPVARRIEAAGDVALVRDHLRQMLGEALASIPGGDAPFRGRAQRLTFLAPTDPFLEVGGISQIDIALEAGASGLDLVEIRRVQRGTGAEPGGRTLLLSGIESARFSYAPPIAGDAPDWRPAWDAAGDPPALIRLDIALEGARPLPPLVVHPGNAGAPAKRPPPAPEAARPAPPAPGQR